MDFIFKSVKDIIVKVTVSLASVGEHFSTGIESSTNTSWIQPQFVVAPSPIDFHRKATHSWCLSIRQRSIRIRTQTLERFE